FITMLEANIREGRYAEAEAAYRQALAVSEKSVRAFPHTELRCRLADSSIHLGMLLLMRDRHEEATRVFRNLFEVAPISATTCNYVAWRLAIDPALQHGAQEIALEFARKAVQLAGEDGTVWNTLGMALLRAGNWKESIKALQMSMNLHKGGD